MLIVLAALPLLCSPQLPDPAAHQAFAVTWHGSIQPIDLPGQAFGPTITNPSMSFNAMARAADGTLILSGSDAATFEEGKTQFFRFDPTVGAITETLTVDGHLDLRGIAFGPEGFLWAIRDMPTSDEDRLLRIDLDGGAVAYVGSTGVENIQGLTYAKGGLIAVTTYGEVLALDSASAQVVETLANTGAPAQWACTDNCGELWLGDNQAYRVDFGAGDPALEGPFPLGTFNIRGVEFVPVFGAAISIPGDPPNPEVLATPDPEAAVLGGELALTLDHTSFVPESQLDLLLGAALPANLALPEGTLLLDPATFAVVPFDRIGATTLPLPAACNQFERTLRVQAASLSPTGTFHLSNALDVTLGATGAP